MMLSIIISERDDPVGTLVTIRALIQHCSGIDYEIVVIDNSDKPESLRSVIPKEYLGGNPVRLLHSPPSLFVARTLGVKEARGKWLLFLDSHMIMGYRAVEFMLEIGERKNGNLGFVYGPCCYHYDSRRFEFVDRDVDSLAGIRRHQAKLDVVRGESRIAFRGVPMLCQKAHFMRIGGYGALAHYALPWGGGDYLLGIKTLMLGYDNFLSDKSVGIHLGPFVGAGSSGFVNSYMITPPPNNWPKFIGMLTAAYIVGGKKVLDQRAAQIKKRIG